MTELLGQVPFDLISLGLLGALGLRRLVLMERLHWPRVVLLTALLWALAFYLLSLTLPESQGCVVTFAECEPFPCTET
jgi:hypothetical protein